MSVIQRVPLIPRCSEGSPPRNSGDGPTTTEGPNARAASGFVGVVGVALGGVGFAGPDSLQAQTATNPANVAHTIVERRDFIFSSVRTSPSGSQSRRASS